jgi:hypothetical protein
MGYGGGERGSYGWRVIVRYGGGIWNALGLRFGDGEGDSLG